MRKRGMVGQGTRHVVLSGGMTKIGRCTGYPRCQPGAQQAVIKLGAGKRGKSACSGSSQSGLVVVASQWRALMGVNAVPQELTTFGRGGAGFQGCQG